MTTTVSYGKIIVSGSDINQAVAQRAYTNEVAGQPFIGDVVPRSYPVEFHSNADFLARGLIIPGTEGTRPKSSANPKGGIAAYGYTLNAALWINEDKRPIYQVYSLRHEPFHPVVSANMTVAKRVRLLPLVQKVVGSPYQNRLSEVLCDAFVELFWGSSVLDKYYGDISDAELQDAWNILTAPIEPTDTPIAVPETPLPLPLPDPNIARIADLEARLAQIATLAAP